VSEDPFESQWWRDYAKHAQDELLPKVEESAIAVSIVPAGEADIKFLLELGAMVWYGKPILVVASEGRPIPEGLRRIATAIVQGNIDQPAGRALMQEKLTEMLEKLPNLGRVSRANDHGFILEGEDLWLNVEENRRRRRSPDRS
jgi:hypothetical protein